jgi:hypothetical protein
MVPSDVPLPHDFPDRVVREALVQPDNLRELVERVLPDMAPHLDFAAREVLPRAFLLEDWRRREGDVLVRVPYRLQGQDRHLLLCLLIEHQSTADPVMPLRLLVYAVLYWEKQWKEWETGHKRGEPLRLTPVLPIVLHTGTEVWDTNRSLTELFEGADVVPMVIPQWQTWLCDLPEFSAAELVQSEAAWWQALAVVRAENAPPAEFLAVLGEALKRLEKLGETVPVRWRDLLRLVLFWAQFRRPTKEHAAILQAVRASHANVKLLKETEKMSQQVELTYEQEMFLRLQARAKKEADEWAKAQVEQQVKAHVEQQVKAQVEQAKLELEKAKAQGEVQTYREMLRRLLEERFGKLPEALLGKLAQADLDRLRAALPQVVHIQALGELQL